MFSWLTRFFKGDNERLDRLSKETKQLQDTLSQTQDELHRLRLLERTDLVDETSYQLKHAEVSFVDPKGTKEIKITSVGGLLRDTQTVTLNETEAKRLLNTLTKYFGENE